MTDGAQAQRTEEESALVHNNVCEKVCATKTLNVTIHGDVVCVPVSIARQIPLLLTLLESKQDEDPIAFDTAERNASPSFLLKLVAWLKTGEKQRKEDLQATFEREDIKRWLSYLGMSALVHQWYGFQQVGERFVIKSIVWYPEQNCFLYTLDDESVMRRPGDTPLRNNNMLYHIRENVQPIRKNPDEPTYFLWRGLIWELDYSMWVADGCYFTDPRATCLYSLISYHPPNAQRFSPALYSHKA